MLLGLRLLRVIILSLTAIALAPRAEAAPSWIFRSITLPRGEVALDMGLGVGHGPPDATGLGMNLEIAGGVTHDLELGFRTGFRFDIDAEVTQADRYGRPFDTETYGTGHDHVANPELRMRWAVARGTNAQLGLEVRAYLPFESGTRFGLMFGLPIALRAGAVRIDTGLYVPVIFTDPTTTIVSVPVHVWIQVTSSVWLGPLFGLRVISQNGSTNEYPLGFGLGTMLRHNIDLRTWFLFEHINGDAAARTFGAGLALQIRFE
jgi:hypothetical protein